MKKIIIFLSICLMLLAPVVVNANCFLAIEHDQIIEQEGDLYNLGYKYAVGDVAAGPGSSMLVYRRPFFQKLLRIKKSGLENLFTRRVAAPTLVLETTTTSLDFARQTTHNTNVLKRGN